MGVAIARRITPAAATAPRPIALAEMAMDSLHKVFVDQTTLS
jgi:hypothetical protein